MDLMLALLVFSSAIILLFANEFERFIQKTASIPGVKLFVPLILASLLIEQYDNWCVWFVLECRSQLHNALQLVVGLLPFRLGAVLLSSVLFLFLPACLPMCLVWVMEKRHKIFRMPISPSYLGYILWIIAAFLLIVKA
jgi:hypothetical protein